MNEARNAHGQVLVVERTRVAAVALAALVQQIGAGWPAVVSAEREQSDVVLRAAAGQRANIVIVGERAGPPLQALARALQRQGSALVAVVDPALAAQELRLLASTGVTMLSSAADGTELRRAMRSAGVGRGFVSADLALRLEGRGAPVGGGCSALSAREHSVARLLSEGADRRAISALLALSPKTVSTYRCRIMRKLRVANEVQLARLFDAERGAARRGAPS